MKKVLIHYFSATGNTARSVQLLKKGMDAAGYSAEIRRIGTAKPSLFGEYDCHIISFPVLAWAPPSFVSRYVKALPQGRGMKAAVFATFGGAPVQAIEQMEKLLKRRGYDVIMTSGALYPDNWSQMMDPAHGAEAADMIKQGDAAVVKFIKEFKQGKRKFFRASLFSSLWSGSVAWIFGLIGRRFLGKCYIADSTCNNCGTCVKACPVKAILFRGSIRKKPMWLFRCEDCNRCINICPKRSIQTSVFRLTLNAVLNILIIVLVMKASPSLVRMVHGKLNILPALLLDVAGIGIMTAVLFWIQFYCVDRIIFILEQIRPLKGFFEFSFTRKYNRYTAPGFKPLKEI
ncbi:MAG: EFR1 family ferrodoxin [bacterium]|nr:EFR1 family ferrodoxin [bacterium]